MTVTHERLSELAKQFEARTGSSEGSATLRVMAIVVMAMAGEIPESLQSAFMSATQRWYAGQSTLGSLQSASVACWEYLEAKNGSSTEINDRSDIAVRALICVLWDEEPDDDDLQMTLDFFAPLADRFGGIAEVLGVSAG